MTNIEWTDATWNPVTGCSKVSEGCRNCYAERLVDGITTTWLVPRGGREPLRTGLVCTVDAGELELKLSSGVWPRDVRFAIAMHVPHPSGRNPQWGANPSLAQRFRDWCRDAFTTHVPR